MKVKEKPKYSILQNIGWMIKNAWHGCRRLLFLVVAIAVLEILYNLAGLYIAPEILDIVQEKGSTAQLLPTIAFFTGALFVTKGLRFYLSTYSDYCRIEVRSTIIGQIAYKSNTTSYPNTLKEDFIGLRESAHHQVEGNHVATEYIWKVLGEFLTNVGGFIIYLFIMSNLDPMLMMVIIITCFVSFFVSRNISSWMYTHRDEEEKYYAQKVYFRSKAESPVIAKDIRIFGLQNWLEELLDKVHNVYLDFRFKVSARFLVGDLVDTVLTMARSGIAYVYLIRMVLAKEIDVAEFVLYFAAVSSFTTWVSGILQNVSRLHKDSLDINKVRMFLEYPEPFIFDGGDAVPKADLYEIKLDSVSYRYPGADKDTIHNIDLTIRAGEKLAVVGLNGAGKTTLVKLICGLIDPTDGRVLLNGTDIRCFNRTEYYRLFSAVFQEFSILDVTVAECITQSTDTVDERKMQWCIEQAGLTDFIAELPDGLQTHVGRDVFSDGVLFSGGQTQRLMLARALYKDGPILLLDEPTAALDPIAENDIYMKYNEMTAGKISVFISHRLASTRFCDRILFLQDGGISEEGTHESLLALGGEYAKLFDVQSRYYQEGREF